MKDIEVQFLKAALESSGNSLHDNVQAVFLKIWRGPAEKTFEAIRPAALCNLCGHVLGAAWWDNFGVYIDHPAAAAAFVYAAGDIYAVFESGLSFSFHSMVAKSMGYALELIESPNRLKYDFTQWSEQTRTRQAKNLIRDYRVFEKIPPVDRLFLPWGAVITRV